VQKFSVKTSSQHDNATQPEEVAKIIFQAISIEKPEFRYVDGNNAVTFLEARKNMLFSEFQKMIIQNIMQWFCMSSNICRRYADNKLRTILPPI
jgi:hypothetical protein